MQEIKVAVSLSQVLKKYGLNRLLAQLKALGIEHVEFFLSTQNPNYEKLQIALTQGFGVSLHLDGGELYKLKNTAVKEQLHRLDYLFSCEYRSMFPVILNVHPCEFGRIKKENLDFTTEKLTSIQEIISKGLNFQLCVENLPPDSNKPARFGNQISDLLQLQREMRRKGHKITFTWDIGHYSANSFLKRYKFGEDLGLLEFLASVCHVHFHGYHPEWGDHIPLRDGIVPIKQFLAPLMQLKFRGIFCLELHPDQIELTHPNRNPLEILRDSVMLLKQSYYALCA